MNTIDRYIVSTYVRNIFLAITALASLYVFQAMLSQLLDHSYPTYQIVYYNLLGLPQIVVQMMPPAIMISTVMTLSGFNRTNELTAFYSIGIGLGRIVIVVMSVVFIVSCLSLVLQDRILPPLFKKRTTYYWREMKKKTDFYLDFRQNKIWYRSKDMIYNLRTFDARTRTILGMAVYMFDDKFNLIQVIDAEKATYTRDGWKLLNGTVTVFSAEDSFPNTRKFAEKDLLIAENPQDFQEIEKEVDGLRIKELYRYIQKTKHSGVETKAYEVRLHSRISLSFIPIVMCVLGVPFSVRNRREGGFAKDIGLCLAVTFFYWLFYSVGLSLGTNGALPPVVSAWLPSAVFAAFAGIMVTRRQH
ncbi:MAG: LPS export ABC transporter permease LptG [Bdellovibrionales bacterium RIFOXYD1_FULL_44_7]|nr:MAG: LPS export ABC transporter permease LptG [Bdellovibrionales bacterium RIFOXYD1_FULL_44_7]